jgi:riboflavin kinase / FMN adenylyltransferase
LAELCDELTEGRPQGRVAATFGVFDGVHLGHRQLIDTLMASANARGMTPVVITLANHPLSVLRPALPVVLLTSLKERVDLLHAAGVAHVIPITFTVELSHLSPEQFMRALGDCLGMRHMVVGPDFAVGQDREGTLPVLESLGTVLGYTMEIAGHYALEGTSVRSSAVRKALAAGDLATVERFLGRRFALDGPVIEGEGRGGGLLGFPTVNVGLGPLQALPADGVYATWIEVDGERYASATSVGIKPTFHEEAPRVVESFILDYDGNLYGQPVRVEFVARLRDQEKFDSVDDLIAQMKLDVDLTREILAR